eukprot:gene25368-biopygen19490
MSQPSLRFSRSSWPETVITLNRGSAATRVLVTTHDPPCCGGSHPGTRNFGCGVASEGPGLEQAPPPRGAGDGRWPTRPEEADGKHPVPPSDHLRDESPLVPKCHFLRLVAGSNPWRCCLRGRLAVDPGPGSGGTRSRERFLGHKRPPPPGPGWRQASRPVGRSSLLPKDSRDLLARAVGVMAQLESDPAEGGTWGAEFGATLPTYHTVRQQEYPPRCDARLTWFGPGRSWVWPGGAGRGGGGPGGAGLAGVPGLGGRAGLAGRPGLGGPGLGGPGRP